MDQTCGILLELGRDAGELGIQLGAEAIDHGDDRNGNPGSDQAVLDGSCPRAIFQETQNKLVHWQVPVLPDTPD